LSGTDYTSEAQLALVESDILIPSSQTEVPDREDGKNEGEMFFHPEFKSILCHIDLKPIIQAQAHQHTKQCSETNFCDWQFHRGDLFHQFRNLARPEGRKWLHLTEGAAERSVTALLCDYKDNKETCFGFI